MSKRVLTIVSLVIASILFLLLYSSQHHNYLRFSDGAKFADVARNLIEGKGYVKNFDFFSERVISTPEDKLFSASSIPRLFPYSIFLSFNIFGVSDLAVVATSAIFYIGAALLTYFLGKKLFDPIVGIFSSLTVASNINLLDYATTGASETALIFLILLTVYLLVLNSKYSILGAFISMGLMYLTRPQAVMFIAGAIFLLLLIKYGYKKGLLYMGVVSLGIIAFDQLILVPLSRQFGVLTPLLDRGFQAIDDFAVASSPSGALRGGGMVVSGTFALLSKAFYNLYNFYRRIPDIMSPYLFFTFVFGFFIRFKDDIAEKAKYAVALVVVFAFMAAALTIPFFRYVHPVMPLVYVFGVGTIFAVSDKLKLKKLIPASLVIVFVIGLSAMTMFVEVRFKKDTSNFGKPPIYVALSERMKGITDEDDVIVTNLDTWGSWYGERKTIWLPLEPEQLNPKEGELTVDVIFITDYLMDDENYYLGEEWRKLLEAPEEVDETVLAEEFEGYEVVEIDAKNTFEDKSARGVLLWRERVE